MKKNLEKTLILLIITLMALLCFACKKKEKHKWIEVGAPTISEAMKTPGVHPERGVETDAINIILAPVYYPTGRDKNGDQNFKKYMYELQEKTPETIDEALKNIKLIDDTSLFCGLELVESDTVLNAGPGAEEAQLTKKGIARYANLSSPIENSADYEGKYYVKDLIGLIDEDAILRSISQTFEENFQLVSCDIEIVDETEYEYYKNKTN